MRHSHLPWALDEFNMKNKTLQNFLMVGAHKCGTTSIHQILSKHPAIFMSRSQEPHFLTWECWNDQPAGPGDDHIYKELACKQSDLYVREFLDSGSNGIRGESSADALCYTTHAIPKIKDLLSDPSILIVLRNPAERAFSAYKHLWRDGRETEIFLKGLELEEQRIWLGYEYMWHYRIGGQYAGHMKSFFGQFRSVHVVSFEDFVRDPVQVIDGVVGFLHLPECKNLPYRLIRNNSGDPRIKWLPNLLKSFLGFPCMLKSNFLCKLKKWLREDLVPLTSRPMKLDADTYNTLFDKCRRDMDELERILGRKCPWLHKAAS